MENWAYCEEDQYGYYEETQVTPLEDNLVDALDASVQQSVSRAVEVAVPKMVNKALAVALRPIIAQLERFAKRHGMLPEPSPSSSGATSAITSASTSSSNWPHAPALTKLPPPPASDHQYMVAGPSQSSSTMVYTTTDTDTDTDTDSTSKTESPKKKKAKKRCGGSQVAPAYQSTSPFDFNPADIVHPRSSDWAPPPEVAGYLQQNLRRSFDREVRSRLRSECPRPDVPNRVAETPEIDPNMLAFLKKFHKDPKKGIDRAWRRCQDKLLDTVGPLAKILELALVAKETGALIDPDILAGWAQRSICFVGNANCAISSERRKSLLMRMDSNLAELASAEPGPLAEGLLFGDKFVKDVSKYMGTFTSLDKAQTNLRKVFQTGLSGRAWRGRGRSPGLSYSQGPQRGGYGSGRGDFQDTTRGGTFYPSRRQFRGRFRHGGQRDNFQPQLTAGADQKGE
ncbi:uncharacterized protein LOC144766620 [Lissotriton helveticus]